MVFKFRENFRLGVATASAQIEGGEAPSNWQAFSDAGKIKDKSSIRRANDHYIRYREDADLLVSLGIKDYRMSVEWARIEPEEGQFSSEALDHYKDELTLLQKSGIRPLITFWHFTHPLWFEALGGFTKRENLKFFFRFIETCLRAFGHLCNDYVTLNEPNVYAVNSFLFGVWPPEIRSLRQTLSVMNVLIEAHLTAYGLIHKIGKELGSTGTRVSFAHHMRIFQPLKDRLLNRLSVQIHDFLFQDGLAEACFNGTFRFPFQNSGNFPPGRYVDFVAINYYTRGRLSLWKEKVPAGSPINDLNWEIYPDGLIACAARCHKMTGLPIRITENGTCDNDDRFRSLYLAAHLEAIAKSLLPIEAYYHWCFIDNFEWKEGERARFGIVHCDYESQERTVKESGRFYARLIKEHGLSKEAKQRYVEHQTYPVAKTMLDRELN